MTNEMLQQWVERVSLRDFGRPFQHQAIFNSRLKATGGRYFTKTHHIEISPHQLQQHGEVETEKIIKHELCHYHLHIMKRGFNHRDADFRQLLAQVGGARYCKALPDRLKPRQLAYRYKLECVSCGMTYLRKRKVDVRRYACGKCRGKLLMKPLDNHIST
jgi:SprT-like protein